MPLEVILPMHPNMTNADWEQRHTLQSMLLKIKKHFVREAPLCDILEQMSTQLESVSVAAGRPGEVWEPLTAGRNCCCYFAGHQ